MKHLNKKQLLALTEESIIFFSIFKWISLASIIGLLVGISTSFFLKCLHYGIDSSHQFSHYYVLLPVALVATVLITRLSSKAKGHGTEKVIEAVHKDNGLIHAIVVPIKFVTTIITLVFGGSAGKEGPSAHIGAGLASIFSNLFRFSESDRKKLVICGISAGFSAVFGTPIAGAIFGVEVLIVGNIRYDVLLPSFVAGMISYYTATYLGIDYHYFPIAIGNIQSIGFLLKVILSGLFFGGISFMFIESMRLTNKVFNKLPIRAYYKAFFGGASLVVLTVLLGTTQYLGLGVDVIDNVLHGHSIIWYAFLIKILFTAITLGCGGSGGLVTPTFFIGATSGMLYGQFIGADPVIFAALGLVAMLSGTANTPIAATIMAVELFGTSLAPFATLACVISFLFTGYRSAYPSQILAMNKAPSIKVKTGNDMEDHETHLEFRTKRWLITGKNISQIFNLSPSKKRRRHLLITNPFDRPRALSKVKPKKENQVARFLKKIISSR